MSETFHSDLTSDQRKNPSRQSCEDIIRRILITEVLTKGRNEQFRRAGDFMNYFESLYPASDSLSKQVQRALSHMGLPKDEFGYLVINKTKDQYQKDLLLSKLFSEENASLDELTDLEPVLLKLNPAVVPYAMEKIASSDTFASSYKTMVPASNGIIFYTKNKATLIKLLNSMII